MTTTLVLDPSTSRTVIAEAGGTTLVQETPSTATQVQETAGSATLVSDLTSHTIVSDGVTRTTIIQAQSGVGPAGPPGEDAAPSFESFAKNLRAYPASFGYAIDGTLETVAYTTPDGTVTKTLGYASERLATITLSGALPSGIDTTKTLVYAGDSLAYFSYS